MENRVKSKKVVIITDIIYPQHSPMGGIGLKVASYLRTKYDVIIISRQFANNRVDGDELYGCHVYTLSQCRLRWAEMANNMRKTSSGVKSFIFNSLFNVLRAIGRIQATFFTIDNMWWYKKAAFKKLLEINSERGIDAVITVSGPIEAHLAGMMFKSRNKKIMWAGYTCDLWASSNFKLNLFWSINRMKKLERKIMGSMDVAFCAEELYEYYTKEYKLYNIHKIPYTLNESILSEAKNGIKGSINDKYSIACIGAFYKILRNPEKMLRILSTPMNNSIVLYLFTCGECEEKIRKYANQRKTTIIQKGVIPFEDLIQELKTMNALIMIGNNSKLCSPSKELEIVSYCKPIIYFYYEDSDTSIIDKYPCKLKISQDMSLNMDEEYIRIVGFLEENKNTHIDVQDIRIIYEKNLEENVKNLFVDIINRGEPNL